MAKVTVSVPSQSNTIIVSPILATPVVTSIPVDNLSDLNLTKSVVQPNQIMVYNGTSWIYDYGHDQKFYAEAYNELVSGVELYYTATADGDGYITQDITATPAEGNEEQRRLYYKSTAFGDSGTTAGYTDAGLATDATYAEMLVAFNNLLKTEGAPITVYATRAEVVSRSGLLADYPGAAAAYSLRLLDTDYTGDAIRVRRASDNTEQDIGFDGNGDLDTAALASFCSGTDGFVKTWYDQSGNANDASQSTTANQPKIYDGTTGVVTENGKPAIDWASDSMVMPASIGVDFSIAWVWRSDDAGLNQLILNTQVDCYWNPSGVYRLYFGGTVYDFPTSQGAVSPTTHSVIWQNYSTSETWYMRSNGNEKSFAAGASYTPSSGSIGQAVDGRIQELIIWNSNQSTNRSDIEDNINTFYSIF